MMEALETGLTRRKSAVRSRDSFDRMDTPRFIAWIVPQRSIKLKIIE
jgi:hypothetical protein